MMCEEAKLECDASCWTIYEDMHDVLKNLRDTSNYLDSNCLQECEKQYMLCCEKVDRCPVVSTATTAIIDN